MESQPVIMDIQIQQKSDEQFSLTPENVQRPEAMYSVATITDINRLVHSHIPEFTRRHPIIPKRYVMPWKQDMVNRKLILRHADQSGVFRGPQEESLFLENKERLCHGEVCHIPMEKMKIPSEKQHTNLPLHSPLSRYQTYVINQRSRNITDKRTLSLSHE
ncbi:PREDICTED: testis-expressed sequence 43 protein [Nanorana parkeri]|uniref:testis-expressed sequence 43 protein n=1 Tax=Nanorana parkeri TaxID=125878 RepID=UPI0008547593|nr:PREDICTED: testis-expressed sequence 43 protein [Nanorana parkeri]